MKNKENKIKRDSSKMTTAIVVAICVVLVAYTISVIIPLGWGFITSLKSKLDFNTLENKLGLPNVKNGISFHECFYLENYTKILTNFSVPVSTSFITATGIVSRSETYGFGMLLVFTLLYAGGGCIITTFVPLVVAFLVVKYPYKFSKFLYAVALLIMIIPIIGATPSELTLLRKLGLYDSILGNYVQKFNFTGMYFFVFVAFFESLSNAYAEAAEIDGATQMDILIRIIIPLAGKIVTTVMLINFISLWDDYQTPLLYLPTKPTIAYGVYHITRDTGQSKGFNFIPIQIAGCMLLALPILIIFICLREKLMGNISMGGLKE